MIFNDQLHAFSLICYGRRPHVMTTPYEQFYYRAYHHAAAAGLSAPGKAVYHLGDIKSVHITNHSRTVPTVEELIIHPPPFGLVLETQQGTAPYHTIMRTHRARIGTETGMELIEKDKSPAFLIGQSLSTILPCSQILQMTVFFFGRCCSPASVTLAWLGSNAVGSGSP
jgi:hypothetical protein